MGHVTPAASLGSHRAISSRLRTRAPADGPHPPPLGERTGPRERRRAAPEAAAGHAGAVHAVGRGEPVHERVDLGHGHGEVVARLAWLAASSSRSALDVAGTERDRRVPTRWFSVSTWRARRRSTASSMDRSSPGRASRSGPMWASAASHSCRWSAWLRSQRGGARRVHHHHLDVAGQAHRLDPEVVAVDARGWPPRGRGELVHDPAGHAGRLLGPLPEQGELGGPGRRRGRGPASSRDALEERPRRPAGCGDVAASPRCRGATSATTPAT